MTESVTIDEIIYLLKERYNEIPPWTIYYALKEWKYKPITETTRHIVRACVAIDDLQLPITRELVNLITERSEKSRAVQTYTTVMLHGLGDRGIILLTNETHGRGGALVWLMNRNFRETVKW